MIRTRVGYAGGKQLNPTYHDLGDHTETLQLDYDPDRISYDELLDVFWSGHDPTAAPWSVQYKAVVFVHDEAQREAATRSLRALERRLGRPIRTQVLPYRNFTLAEDYHQKYSLRHHADLLQALAAAYGEGRALNAALVASTAAARLNGYAARQGSSAALERELPSLGISPESGARLLDGLRAREASGRAAPGCR